MAQWPSCYQLPYHWTRLYQYSVYLTATLTPEESDITPEVPQTCCDEEE